MDNEAKALMAGLDYIEKALEKPVQKNASIEAVRAKVSEAIRTLDVFVDDPSVIAVCPDLDYVLEILIGAHRELVEFLKEGEKEND